GRDADRSSTSRRSSIRTRRTTSRRAPSTTRRPVRACRRARWSRASNRSGSDAPREFAAVAGPSYSVAPSSMFLHEQIDPSHRFRERRRRARRRRRLRRIALLAVLVAVGAGFGFGFTFFGQHAPVSRVQPVVSEVPQRAAPTLPRQATVPSEIRGIHLTMGL